MQMGRRGEDQRKCELLACFLPIPSPVELMALADMPFSQAAA
jgi:hypothetical protein